MVISKPVDSQRKSASSPSDTLVWVGRDNLAQGTVTSGPCHDHKHTITLVYQIWTLASLEAPRWIASLKFEELVTHDYTIEAFK